MSSHSEPKRIQRKRVKGWRLPHGATCVTRPGKFGNPLDTAAEFRSWMKLIDDGFVVEPCSETIQRMVWIHKNVHKLKGFDLACFCKPEDDCHATVLLQYANR